MQKKIFLCFIMTILTGLFSSVNAKTIVAATFDKFSTANPPQSIEIKIFNPLELSDSLTIPAGSTVQGQLVNVISPKRLKRNAKFSFRPEWYADANGTKHNINDSVIGTYTTTIDKAQLAKSAVLGVGNHFVKGLSMGVAAVEGAIENEEGNIIKSSAKSVYEASPLSYTKKGQDLYFEKNSVFYLKFPDVKKQ
ncbi:hypothetical protein J6I39_08915 [bacterium]|nr:hypothetical protein [bacterium]